MYNINNESVNHFSQLISVKIKKNLRKSLAQFREKLRKLPLRQNDGFPIKKRVLKQDALTPKKLFVFFYVTQGVFHGNLTTGPTPHGNPISYATKFSLYTSLVPMYQKGT